MESAKKTFSGKLFSEVNYIINADGNYLFCKYWEPDSPPKFLICLLHGLGGHCARFEELALYLNSLGGFVFAHDHVGHGESEGARTTVKAYEIYIKDIFLHIEKIKNSYPNLPLFLLGNSMGGALALLASHEKSELFTGVIITAGMLLMNPRMSSMITQFFISILGSVAPGMQLATLDETESSRDANEVIAVENDPLKSSVIKSEMVCQLISISKAVNNTMDDFSVPFLALHGGADKTCDPEGSKLLHERSKSLDKTLKIYPACCHDLLHELPKDKQIFLKDVGEWITNRIP